LVYDICKQSKGQTMDVGIVLLIEGNEEVGFPRYREVRDFARQAEAAQLDSLWVYDHLLFGSDPPKGQWECFTFLPALAEATERIQLGTLVACTAFRNPAMLAKIAITLDEVCNGRFTLGLGAGWNQREFDAFGFPFDHRVDRFEEALKIIVPLVRDRKVDYQGQYAQANNCEMVPQGPRPGGVPIMIGATGPRMTRLTAQYADSINTGVDLSNPAKTFEQVAVACAEFGRDTSSLPITTPVWTAFPDLGLIPDHMRESTYSSAAEVADVLKAYDQAGVAHVMLDFKPNNSAALARVIEALKLYRSK
jgi:alkanesulfonate monooxygenase SsuD/methylene tetrahydromethanopterin reductase-like flavin-dependent oxidoreductase (luciferase family)